MWRTKYGQVYCYVELTGLHPTVRDVEKELGAIPIGEGLYQFGVTRREVVEAVLPGVSYDWAVPQSWFDANCRRGAGGKVITPDAIWVYDKGIAGRPVHFYDLLARYKRLVLDAVGHTASEPLD